MLKPFILLLPSFVCLFSAVTLFVRRKKNTRSQNIWMVCMLLMSVSTYIWGMFYSGEVDDFSLYYKLDVIDATFGLMMFPFIRLYFKSLTDERPLRWKEESLWFLPALLMGVGSTLIYGYMGDERATDYIRAVLLDYRNLTDYTAPIYKIHLWVNVIGYYVTWVIQLLIVMRYTVVCLVKYRKRLSDYFSNLEGKSLENIRAMLITISVLLAVFLLGIVDEWLFSRSLIYLLLGAVAGLLYYLNYLVVLVPYTAENLAEELLQSDRESETQEYVMVSEPEDEEYVATDTKEYKREEIISQINKSLNEDKLFLLKDLRLDDLVRLTQVNRNYVSSLINEEYQCTFLELINSKRIAYAKQLAIDHPRMSHAHIAAESGFANPASLNQVFKQQEGIAFNEWHGKNVN